MASITQGAFKIDIGGSVTIDKGQGSQNEIDITVTNTGSAPAQVRVTMEVICGQFSNALLAESTQKVIATYGSPAVKLTPRESPQRVSWTTSSSGKTINGGGGQLSLRLSGFESNTPPGEAEINVVVQTRSDESAPWMPDDWDSIPDQNKILTIAKTAVQSSTPTIHYFTVTPDYILHGGDTQVTVSFYATRFTSIVLFRNNQEVQNWPSNQNPANQDGSITGLFPDKPSITTVYRLEAKPEDGDRQIQYLTVQVIAPGWNQIALPQGYPTRLFVNADFNPGQGNARSQRLYGIFVDDNGDAGLYSSATGVDDWRPEAGIPDGMAASPGVAFDDKLWLIGGSCYDPNVAGAQVWCYDKVTDTSDERTWKQLDDFPTERMGHACVVFPLPDANGNLKNRLCVLGGYNNGKYYNDVWWYDGGTWVQLPQSSPCWTPRLMHAAVSFQPPTPDGEDPLPPELYVFGGTDNSSPSGLQDLWLTKDGTTWKQLVTQEDRGIKPPTGAPLAAALVSAVGPGENSAARLFLFGSFLQSNDGNRIVSLSLESKRLSKVWQQNPVIDGWEQFEGSFFYMQAIAFNGFIFVWSLISGVEELPPPKLNILIPR